MPSHRARLHLKVPFPPGQQSPFLFSGLIEKEPVRDPTGGFVNRLGGGLPTFHWPTGHVAPPNWQAGWGA